MYSLVVFLRSSGFTSGSELKSQRRYITSSPSLTALVDRVRVSCFTPAVIRCPSNAHSLGVDNIGWDGTSCARDVQSEQTGIVVAGENERPPMAPDRDVVDGSTQYCDSDHSRTGDMKLPQRHQELPWQRQHPSPENIPQETAIKQTTDNIIVSPSSLAVLPPSKLSRSCPVTKLEPVAVTLYQDFRRRYGLVRTAEERIVALLGSVMEYMKRSAILRLFARMVGAPGHGLGQEGG